MRYLGIDIGKSGAIASIDGDDFIVFDMPTFSVKKGRKLTRQIDRSGLFKILKSQVTKDMICFVERNRPWPREGVISSFTLGEQVGLTLGYLIALGIPYQVIYPQTWYKHFSIVKEGGTKNASYDMASSLFPKAILKTERGRIIDGRCDALLIAEYARRNYVNKEKADGQKAG
jgi:hypothetical protein